MRSRPLALLLTLAAVLTLGAGPAAAQAPDWKKLRIGVEGAYPPFSEVGPDGKLKGFDIDIALALCTEIKAECSLVAQEWDGIIPALQARKFDAIVASMAITEERLKVVNFSAKYYNTPSRLVAKAGSKLEASAAGLKGKRIGVQRSTIQDRFATASFPGAEIVRYAKADEVYLDLAAGRIEAVLGDVLAVQFGFLKTPQGKGFEFFGPSYDDPKFFGTGSGIAVRKADAALQAKLNAAILAIRANGVYKKINDKYFDFDVYGK